MLKHALLLSLTAACCFATAAATGLGAGSAKVFTLRVGDIASFPSDNFHCQAVSTTQVACGAKLSGNSVQVYYAPHELEVVKFNAKLTKAEILLNLAR